MSPSVRFSRPTALPRWPFSLTMRSRLTVISSLLRRVSSRAAMICSCVLSSKSWARALRSSGDFCVAPCWKIFCLSPLICSMRLKRRSRCFVRRISSLRSSWRLSSLRVFLCPKILSIRAIFVSTGFRLAALSLGRGGSLIRCRRGRWNGRLRRRGGFRRRGCLGLFGFVQKLLVNGLLFIAHPAMGGGTDGFGQFAAGLELGQNILRRGGVG